MRIRFTATWRYGEEFWNAGDYRIPEDMAVGVAEAALAQSAAVRLDGDKRKGPAPENKAARAAETK